MFCALQHQHDFAVRLGKLCIFVAVTAALTLGWLAWNDLMPGFYLLVASPASLGFIALQVTKRNRGKPPIEAGKFSLGSIVFFMTVIAIAAALLRYGYQSQTESKYQAEALFRHHEELSDVKATGFWDDGYFRATGVQFRISGRPDSLIELQLMPNSKRLAEESLDAELELIIVRQIGAARPNCVVTASKVLHQNAFALGTKGWGNQVTKYQIHSIHDLLQNYDKLAHDLLGWPTVNAKEVQLTDGTRVKYCVEIDGAVLQSQVDRDELASSHNE